MHKYILLSLLISNSLIDTIAQPTWTKLTVDASFSGALIPNVVDLDGDGDMDIVAVGDAGNLLNWYRNNGSQSFTEINIDNGTTNIDRPLCVVAFDMDGDGDIDIVTNSYDDDHVLWYENNGSESFTRRTIDNGGLNGAMWVDYEDINDDGDMDVIATGYIADDVVYYENDGSENFTKNIIEATFNGARELHPADLDGDGDMDIVATADIADDLAWYENNGSESFTERIIDANENAINGIKIIDLDEDGDLDIVAGVYLADDVVWFENNGSEVFTKRTIDFNLNGVAKVQVGDIDNDGDIDILAAAIDANDVVWYDNNGSESFTKRNIDINLSLVVGIELVDVDGDGDLDVTACANGGNTMVWYENSTTALPISLTKFNATIEDGLVRIAWNTMSEINNDFFTIERSVDGLNWKPIAKIQGAGNSTELLAYESIDGNPLSGISYYRLKQTDFNGQYEYFNAVSISNNAEKENLVEGPFTVFPNPLNNERLEIVFSDLKESQNTYIKICDASGKAVYSYYYKEVLNNHIILQIDDLISKGTYTIQVESNNYFHVKRLIVR